jgi:hypothetical protein
VLLDNKIDHVSQQRLALLAETDNHETCTPAR